MTGWVDRFTGRNIKSGKQAKDRLRLVLIHDRTDLNSETIEALKDELLEVISRYIAIDPAAVSINMAQDGREQRLIADIPLQATKRRRVR
jgi:cell division topological specificity factor